jgi:hypothetical protein
MSNPPKTYIYQDISRAAPRGTPAGQTGPRQCSKTPGAGSRGNTRCPRTQRFCWTRSSAARPTQTQTHQAQQTADSSSTTAPAPPASRQPLAASRQPPAASSLERGASSWWMSHAPRVVHGGIDWSGIVTELRSRIASKTEVHVARAGTWKKVQEICAAHHSSTYRISAVCLEGAGEDLDICIVSINRTALRVKLDVGTRN